MRSPRGGRKIFPEWYQAGDSRGGSGRELRRWRGCWSSSRGVSDLGTDAGGAGPDVQGDRPPERVFSRCSFSAEHWKRRPRMWKVLRGVRGRHPSRLEMRDGKLVPAGRAKRAAGRAPDVGDDYRRGLCPLVKVVARSPILLTSGQTWSAGKCVPACFCGPPIPVGRRHTAHETRAERRRRR